MTSAAESRTLPIVPGWSLLLLLLWAQLFAACIYAWRFGEYYDYGWYVPPLFAWFLWRIRGEFGRSVQSTLPISLIIPSLIGLSAVLFCLRVLEKVDPRWTLPIWIHAILVIGITFFIAFRTGGIQAAKRLIPIVIFACTAIPLPTLIEKLLVSNLTSGVLTTSEFVLKLVGLEVATLGDRLIFMDELVEVTDGCSGIRSAQSFLMSSLFFGELMKLRYPRRILLVVVGIAIAWVLNVVRASSLAAIQFLNGRDAFEQAHDSAGLLAFIVGSTLLYVLSSWIGRQDRRPVVRKVVKKETP